MERGSLQLTSTFRKNNFLYSNKVTTTICPTEFNTMGSRFYDYTEKEVSDEATRIWKNYPSNIANFIFEQRINANRESQIPNFTRDEAAADRPDYFGFDHSIVPPKRKNWLDYLNLYRIKNRILKFQKTLSISSNHMFCGKDCRHCQHVWEKDPDIKYPLISRHCRNEPFFKNRIERIVQEMEKPNYFYLLCWKLKPRFKIWLERSRRSKQVGYVISHKKCQI